MKKGILFSVVALFCVALVYAAATTFTNLKVNGTLEVDGATTLSGATTVSKLLIPQVDVAVATPTALGQLVRNSSYVLYISTLTSSPAGWQKVGSQ
jgi:hypothetical protein